MNEEKQAPMIDKVYISGLSWDLPIAGVLNSSGRWVVAAMQTYGPELVAMLWRILGNEQDVCDAYQDTFLKLAHYDRGQKPQNVKKGIFSAQQATWQLQC